MGDFGMDIRDSTRCLPLAQKGGKLDSAQLSNTAPTYTYAPVKQCGERAGATETHQERKIYIWLIYGKKIKGEISDKGDGGGGGGIIGPSQTGPFRGKEN